MKSSHLAMVMLAGLALGLAGCDPAEPKAEAPTPEVPAATYGPAMPIPPVEPSPIPSLPQPTRPGDKAAEMSPEPKAAEASPDEKQGERKPEAPK